MAGTSSLLLFLGCLVVLHGIASANQADQLRKLIKSDRSRRAIHGVLEEESLGEMPDAEPFSPVHVLSQEGLKEADKIRRLPGQPKDVDFDQYGGYVTVDKKTGRALYYYFVESPQDSSKKPLVLWLNGGPGCSSLGFGAFEELGPFRVHPGGRTLYRNPDAWNKAANILFLESPAGVGFSYTNTSADLDVSGDKRTAEDSYRFLINWLERFPQYKSRDFFISGESYAGHYIPQLSEVILRKNQVITNQTVINLKGVLLGNPFIDSATNDLGEFQFLWKRDVLSDQSYADYLKYCNSSDPKDVDKCSNVWNSADIGSIDPYDIYAPNCDLSSNSTSALGATFDPCTDEYVGAYLNNPVVQQALHANITGIPYPWDFCNRLSWHDRPPTVLPIVKQLTKSGIRVWIFSGDTDSVCSLTGTKLALEVLGLPISRPWKPWNATEIEVGGFVVGYEGLTLVTVRGSGHMVPSYQPSRAFKVFDSFLQGVDPGSS